MPESSASAGKLVTALAWRALARAFSMNVAWGSSASAMQRSAWPIRSMPRGESRRRNSRSFPGLAEARTKREGALIHVHHGSLLERSLLAGNELANAALGERNESIHFASHQRRPLSRGLNFDEAAAPGHHDVHVGIAPGILGVVEIEQYPVSNDTHRNGSNEILERLAGDETQGLAPGHRIVQCHASAGNGRAARPPVGLDHIAVESDRALTERGQVGDGAHAATDQALDLLCTSRLPAIGGLTSHARVGGARQHAIFGGNPALSLSLEKWRHAFLHRRSANDARVTALDQHRTLGMPVAVARDSK